MMKLKLSKTAKILIIVVVIVGGSIPAYYFLIRGNNQKNKDLIVIVPPEYPLANRAININTTIQLFDTTSYHSALYQPFLSYSKNEFYRDLGQTDEAIIQEIFGIKQSLYYNNGSVKIFVFLSYVPETLTYWYTFLFKYQTTWIFRTAHSNVYPSQVWGPIHSEVAFVTNNLPEYQYFT